MHAMYSKEVEASKYHQHQGDEVQSPGKIECGASCVSGPLYWRELDRRGTNDHYLRSTG